MRVNVRTTPTASVKLLCRNAKSAVGSYGCVPLCKPHYAAFDGQADAVNTLWASRRCRSGKGGAAVNDIDVK